MHYVRSEYPRRFKIDRRGQFVYTECYPERRSGTDRRSGIDRRKILYEFNVKKD